jgi:hypothetical protein
LPVGERRRPKAGALPAPKPARNPKVPARCGSDVGWRPKAPALGFCVAPESRADAAPARRVPPLPDAHRPGGRWSLAVPRAPGGAVGLYLRLPKEPSARAASTRPEGRAPAGAVTSPRRGRVLPPRRGVGTSACRLWSRRTKAPVDPQSPEGPWCPGGPVSPGGLSSWRGLRLLPRREGGSARPGASGGGLRRVPRPPRAARVQTISSASFFIGLRRWSDSVGVRYAPPAEASGSPARRPEDLRRRSAGPAAEAAWLRFPGMPGLGRRRMAGTEVPIPQAEARGRRGAGTRGCRCCRGPRPPARCRPPWLAPWLGPKPAPGLRPGCLRWLGATPVDSSRSPGRGGSDEDRTVWVVTSKIVSEEPTLSVERFHP